MFILENLQATLITQLIFGRLGGIRGQEPNRHLSLALPIGTVAGFPGLGAPASPGTKASRPPSAGPISPPSPRGGRRSVPAVPAATRPDPARRPRTEAIFRHRDPTTRGSGLPHPCLICVLLRGIPSRNRLFKWPIRKRDRCPQPFRNGEQRLDRVALARRHADSSRCAPGIPGGIGRGDLADSVGRIGSAPWTWLHRPKSGPDDPISEVLYVKRWPWVAHRLREAQS